MHVCLYEDVCRYMLSTNGTTWLNRLTLALCRYGPPSEMEGETKPPLFR